jgi:hypothetical protein
MNPPTPVAARVPREKAEAYLRKRVRSELAGNIAGTVLSLAGAAFVFFGIVFFSALFSLQGNGRLSATWMWLAIGITAFAFIAYAFTDPEYLSKLEVHTVDGRPAYSIRLPGGWRLSNVDYLNPRNARSMAKVILQILTAGPRALVSSWRYAVRAAALRRVDPGELAGIFAMLAERGRRVPYNELGGQALRDPEKAFADLLLLDVAQHLPTSPEGMVITSKCREQITGITSDGTDF